MATASAMKMMKSPANVVTGNRSLVTASSTPNSSVAASNSANVLSGAGTTSGATLVQRWEATAKISDAAALRVAAAGKLATERSIPEKFFKVEVPVLQVGQLSLNEEIENMQQFYEWFGKLEELVGNEQEEEYSEYLLRLKEYLQSCERLLGRIDGALVYLRNLNNQYQVVSTKTGELHQACEELLNEQRRHAAYADNIQNKLSYFNELDRINTKLNNPNISVQDEAFAAILKRLDQCVSFISQNSTFQESEAYLVKFRQLQSRGLALIKTKIINELRRETNAVLAQTAASNAAALTGTSSATGSPSTLPSTTPLSTSVVSTSGVASSATSSKTESIENALFNVKFRAIAQRLRPLCRELEARSQVRDLAVLLTDVQSCYFQQRQLLLSSNIHSRLQLSIASSSKLEDAIRAGCFYLIEICHLEYGLFHQFFSSPTPNLRATLEGFCRLLYDSYRPLFIREHRIEELCTLVNILKIEILSEQLGRRGESVAAFKPIVNRMIEDIQERLSFLALTYIRDEISAYVPTEADLDYPKKLLQGKTASGNDLSAYPFEVQAMESSWYPTLRRTIICLSKLYQTVNSKILEELAQDAVSECTYSLVRASKQVARTKSTLDGQLFLIMHLLILREQIGPFDIDFKIVEKTLDFSLMRAAITRILTGQTSIWSREGGILGFVAPRVRDNQIDSKKALEKQLRESIEECISSIIQHIMSKLISFITTANAWLSANSKKEAAVASSSSSSSTSLSSSSSSTTSSLSPSSSSSTPGLRDQAFAHPTKVKAIMDEAKSLVREYLPVTVSKMRVYLCSPSNETNFNNIMNTLKENMRQYLTQITSLLNQNYLPEDLHLIGIGTSSSSSSSSSTNELNQDDIFTQLDIIFSSTDFSASALLFSSSSSSLPSSSSSSALSNGFPKSSSSSSVAPTTTPTATTSSPSPSSSSLSSLSPTSPPPSAQEV